MRKLTEAKVGRLTTKRQLATKKGTDLGYWEVSLVANAINENDEPSRLK